MYHAVHDCCRKRSGRFWVNLDTRKSVEIKTDIGKYSLTPYKNRAAT